jgi:Aspartyl protease
LPYFNLQISPQGLIANAIISVGQARRSALVASQQPIPSAAQARLLVDTGASNTCVDPSILHGLGLTPTGVATVNTPTTGTQPQTQDQYDVGLLIPGTLTTHVPLMVPNLPVICAEFLQAQGFHGLLGRDILSKCILIYNGPMNFFTVAY